ncbi:hypothetical protein [Acinetobacter sp. NigerLNRRAM0016]
MDYSIESLLIDANSEFNTDSQANFTIEVRNIEEGHLVMLSRAQIIPCSLEKIALPEECAFYADGNGNQNILCPRGKDIVTSVMLLILERIEDNGWGINKVAAQSNQQLFDYPKIIEAYSRNPDVIFN